MEKEPILSSNDVVKEFDGDEDIFRCDYCGDYGCIDDGCGAQEEPDFE
jgi:hypothetical protein